MVSKDIGLRIMPVVHALWSTEWHGVRREIQEVRDLV
tara:strand:- start:132 stop:242 length:111 start_codon:yes stop_codon:yes gene_type:complete